MYGIEIRDFKEALNENGELILSRKLFDKSRGEWIPHDFANSFPEWCLESERDILANPKNYNYMETWLDILNNFVLWIDGKMFGLYQNRGLYMREITEIKGVGLIKEL